MSVPAKKKPKSAVRKKRSHLALKKRNLTACSNCKKLILPHHACPFCGFYKGTEVVHIKLKKEKEKKKKEKEKKKRKPSKSSSAEKKEKKTKKE